MNDLTVLQAAQGLCVYLEEQFGDEGKERGVVIGYDHRAFGALNSERFATVSAAVFMTRGFHVHLYDGIVATPMVVRFPFPCPAPASLALADVRVLLL